MRYYYIVCLILFILLLCGIAAALVSLNRDKRNCIAMPKYYLVVGIVCACTFPIALFFAKDSVPHIVLFSASFLGSLCLILAHLNCRIYYDETSFTVKGFFGTRRTYSYPEIEYIRGKRKDVNLYIGKQIITINEHAPKKYEFLTLARAQYRKYHNGNAIPQRSQYKKDLFCGHVEEPESFIIAYALISVLIIGCLIASFVLVKEATAADFEPITVSPDSCEIVLGDLRLYEKDDPTYYSIQNYAKYMEDPEGVPALLEKGQSLQVLAKYHADKGRSYFSVASLTGEDGTAYYTLEMYNQNYMENLRIIRIILGIFGIVWGGFVALSIYVGRHPDKFSKKFIRLFFKDGYIH